MVAFVFGIIFGVIAVIALLLGFFGVASKEDENRSFGAGAIGVFFICAIVCVGCILGSTIYTVGTGNVAVITSFGNVQDGVVTSGLHTKAPWKASHQMSVQQQSYTISVTEGESTESGEQPITALTSDGLAIDLDFTIWYYLNGDDADTMFRELGTNYIAKVLKPAIRTAARDAARNYTAQVAYTSGRDALQAEIQSGVIRLIGLVPGAEGLQIVEVNIRHIGLPAQIASAIEAKLKSQQEAEQMEFVLQKERQLAEQRVIQANGIAEAQGIIDSSLTPEYLQWKYIEELAKLVESDSTTTVILPFDQSLIPMLNISTDNLTH